MINHSPSSLHLVHYPSYHKNYTEKQKKTHQEEIKPSMFQTNHTAGCLLWKIEFCLFCASKKRYTRQHFPDCHLPSTWGRRGWVQMFLALQWQRHAANQWWSLAQRSALAGQLPAAQMANTNITMHACCTLTYKHSNISSVKRTTGENIFAIAPPPWSSFNWFPKFPFHVLWAGVGWLSFRVIFYQCVKHWYQEHSWAHLATSHNSTTLYRTTPNKTK